LIINLSNGAEFLNEKFRNKYGNILNENYRKDFSLKDQKEIIVACI
jgi:hypothetical protein